ncbi:MAG: hypothetical protein U0230_04700 [Polyangiales bacterium]
MRLQNVSRVVFGILFVGMGVTHFLREDLFLRIMPPYLPAPTVLNRVAGFFEILGGLGVQMPDPLIRRVAGWGCVALLLAVYVVNIDMALHGSPLRDGTLVPGGNAALWARLPLQFVFIAWALSISRPARGHYEAGAKM